MEAFTAAAFIGEHTCAVAWAWAWVPLPSVQQWQPHTTAEPSVEIIPIHHAIS
jgi:hypothetical protein